MQILSSDNHRIMIYHKQIAFFIIYTNCISHNFNLVQRKLFGVLHADVAVSPRNVIGHSVDIWPDVHVHVRAVYIEDALLAKLGARFQENLLDLHYIVFNDATN